MNNNSCKIINSVSRGEIYLNDFPQLKVEGSDELQVLCPVSKLTGFPMSMQESILHITDGNSRLAEMLFQEMDVVSDSNQVSDDDKLSLLVSRLDSGSFFENDNAVEILGKFAKEFMPKSSVEKVVEQVKAVDDPVLVDPE